MPKNHFYIVLAIFMVLIPEAALAQTGNIATDALNEFQKSVDGWGDVMVNAAKALLKVTLLVELGLFGVKVALHRSQLHEIVVEFTMILFFAGFILAVIVNYQEWSIAIINGLQSLTGDLGYTKVDAGDPFTTAAELIEQMTERLSQIKVGFKMVAESLFLYFAALVIGTSFMLISGVVVIIKCEFIIVANTALLLLGMGGSKIFKEYAINVMRYVFSVAVKLLVMQIVVGIGMDIFKTIDLSGDELTSSSTLVIASAASVLLLVIAWIIPNTVAGIMNGSHIQSGNPLPAAGMAVARGARDLVSKTAGKGGAVAGSAMEKITNLKLASKIAGESGAKGLARFGHMRQTLQEAKMATNPTSMRSQLGSKLNQVRAAKR